MQLPSEDYLLVAAIDFGTTYSGYAFSMRDEFQKDPLKIHTNQAWNAGSKQLVSLKTPTCLLLNSEKKLEAFGYEAENKYAELYMDDKHRDYYFFHRFKMTLHNTKKLTKEMLIEDITGKSALAMDVFALSIQALMDHLLTLLETRGTGIDKKEIQWVLTVPAIWTDGAKQFMRRSAEMAGIGGDHLRIALEPEAASIYCQHLPCGRIKALDDQNVEVAKVGTKYMVVDLGGGTADLTVHEKTNDGMLKEICRASGGECGGTSVDAAFFQMLEGITGNEVITALKHDHSDAYLDLCREFEGKKRSIVPKQTGKINIIIPFTILNNLCQKHRNKDFGSLVELWEHSAMLELRHDKLRIDAAHFISLFRPTITKICQLINELLGRKNANGLTELILVGGFSNCALIQNSIKSKFPEQRIITSEDSELSIIKGAVIFGHQPGSVIARVAQFSYGFSIHKQYNPSVHDRKYMKMVDGKERCNKLFDCILKRDTIIPTGTKTTKVYTKEPAHRDKTLKLFKSENECPIYTDEDGCSLVGELSVDCMDRIKRLTVNVDIFFGETEIGVTITEHDSERVYKGTFDMV